jgi:eukaryotic-like serine/threonine-protein kinase
LCQHEVLEKPVAMKVLRREYVLHEDLIERFLNEARASSAIKSPRIVDTIDVGTLPDGTPYFVMEYVEGETLASLLDREGAIDLVRAVDITKQMAEGLEAAHAAGVIHRDLKPENVFLAPGEGGIPYVKIFDFGIAKVARARKRLTYAGAVFGTPHYMSPEQARGEEVDQRSDVYALGVMLFETITGKVPFDGDDPLAVMSQHVDRAPPLMATMRGSPIPPAVEAVVARCLAKDVRDRYASAAELLLGLNSLDATELAGALPAAPAQALPSAPSLPQASQPTPSRLASLPSSRPETLHAHEVPSGEPPAKRRYMVAAGAFATLAAVAALAWGVSRDADTPVVSAPKTHETVKVDFVLSPIDSHLFRGDEDLGPMPLSVQVEEGTPVTLTVRRKGYTSRRVVVDGTETRVVVGLLRADPPPNQATNRTYIVKKRSK